MTKKRREDDPESKKNSKCKDDFLDLPRDLDQESVNLLMAEYQHHSADFLNNEAMGERRVNIFIGVIAAITAAVGIAAKEMQLDLKTLTIVVAVGSVPLLLFGLVTLRRLMERNLHTTVCLNGLRRINAYFVNRDRGLARVLIRVPCKPIPRKPTWVFGKGGHLEAVAIINCLLVAMVTWALVWPKQVVPTQQGLIIAFLGAVVVTARLLQSLWTCRVYKKKKKEREVKRKKALEYWDTNRYWYRVGVGLVVLNNDGRLLAFERKKVPDAWQLPQGGLEPKEDWEEAAWRELTDETALTSREVDLEAVSEKCTVYELPADKRSEKTGRGQIHRWFLFRLRQGAELPKMPSDQAAEFRSREWRTVSEVIENAASFRQPVYRAVADWLSDRLK